MTSIRSKFIKVGRTGYLLAVVVFASVASAQTGGSFDLSWASVDSGGGYSEGGVFKLAGVAGQPEAGASSSGGTFVLSPGFLQDASYFPVPVKLSGFTVE